MRFVVRVFEKHMEKISSYKQDNFKSNDILAIIRKDFEGISFVVESGKKASQKIQVPVLFGRKGVPSQFFEADAYSISKKTVLEVEAGRGFLNNQFLKDLFQACMMHDVEYLVIAVRNIYLKKNKDFEGVVSFFDTLYASDRMSLPLKGILVIGY